MNPVKKDWLIIANGEPLPIGQLLDLAKNKSVMMLDGAFKMPLLSYLKPDVVLGDFDSGPITNEDKTIKVVHTPDQDATDLEKGLKYLENLSVDTVTIANATGWRLDHTLYNLRLLKRFNEKFKSLILYTALEKVVYVADKSITLQAQNSQPVALLGFTEAIVNSSGLEYEMKNLSLRFGIQESTSNRLHSLTATLEIKGEVLLLISHETELKGL
jgi:thiamine pyrophosphokinase